jgi:Low-density lipoprotein receptor repeat class B
MIWWPNFSINTISFARLDGSGAGDLNTAGATVSNARGIAVDPAAGRVYWSNASGAKISFANLDGSGGGNLNTGAATVNNPRGVAIDPAARRIYWANSGAANQISFADLDSGVGADLNTAGATVNSPHGVAIDAAAGKIYWANQGAPAISFARLDGSGGADLSTGVATLNGANFPSLLEKPKAEAAPVISGGPGVGQILNCSQGGWGADLLPSFLYRAPASFSYSWSKDGAQLAPTAPASIGADAVAEYRCTVTAENFAGSSSQTSPPFGVFAVGRVKLNKRRGTAVFPVTVPGAGVATLTGKGVVKQRSAARFSGAIAKAVSAAGVVKLKVKAKGKTKKRLRKKGRAKVKVTIGFVPTGGSGGTKTKSVTLKKK